MYQQAMGVEQQREELLHKIEELKELQTKEFPERNVVHLGLNFFAEVDKDKAQEMIQKRLNRLEPMYASICQLSGVNEEGLPVFDIVEELDDDDNVVKATVNRTGWPANDPSQHVPNPTLLNDEQTKQETKTEHPAVIKTAFEIKKPVDAKADSVVNKPQTNDAAELSKHNSKSAKAKTENTEPLDSGNTNCHSAKSDNDQTSNPTSITRAEPLPDVSKTGGDGNRNDDDNNSGDEKFNGKNNAIAVTDITDSSLTSADSSLFSKSAEDSSQGEYRDIDPSDLLELELDLSDNDVEYDFDDVEEESGEESDEEQRYSLFPESTLKLIEAHLASQNLLDDADLSDLGEVDAEVPKIKEILVETAETAENNDKVHEIESAEPVQDISEKVDNNTNAKDPETKANDDKPQEAVVKDISEKDTAEIAVVETEKKAVKFSEKVDVKEFQIDRREHKQMPKVSKFKQARAMESQRNASNKTATAAAVAASRMKPADTPQQNLKSIMKKPVKRPQVQPQKPVQKPVQKTKPTQKPVQAQLPQKASGPGQPPQPEQIKQLESQQKQKKIEKDTQQFIADSYIPDKDFLALHDEESNEKKPKEDKESKDSSKKKSPAKPQPIVAEKLVERVNPEQKSDDLTDMAEVKARYQQLKQRMVYANGNYVAKENAVEPLQKRKVSRFKAARP